MFVLHGFNPSQLRWQISRALQRPLFYCRALCKVLSRAKGKNPAIIFVTQSMYIEEGWYTAGTLQFTCWRGTYSIIGAARFIWF
jgi:hypothetical protein